MPLESLRQPFDPEQAGHKLREVQIEHEPEKETNEVFREKYEDLKSQFYDENNQKWCRGRDQLVFLADAQLVDTLILAELGDTEAAKKRFEELQAGKFFNQEKNQWNASFGQSMRYAEDQLLAVWAEQMWNPEHAVERSEALSDFINPEGGWLDFPTEVTAQLNFRTAPQLLRILIEQKMAPDSAQKKFSLLKKSVHYDTKKMQWNYGSNSTMRDFCDQALGILVEMEYDLDSAQKQYDRLKETLLYDKATREWHRSLRDNQSLYREEVFTYDQLLALLVEMRLAHKAKEQKLEPPVQLPTERNF